MTTLQDKSPSELNVICAELCGWHHFGCTGCACTPCRCNQWIRADDGPCELPPYATSYDAIMREIAKLTDGQIKKLGSVIFNLMRPPHVRIPEAWTADQHELIGDVIHRISPADLTRALIFVLQST